jgi:CRISPR-associated endonuclease/helicase Cas3
MLDIADFSPFFREVHGVDPFPWQRTLLERVAKTGGWPGVLELPTGCGKTAAIDIALFHLALDASKGEARRAAVRIAFVVDRRLVVDDAYARAHKLQDALTNPRGAITARVATELRVLSLDGPPLIARRMRGGIPREEDWARTPSQPTVLCSTVDQVGSRLLFRGYGVSDSMKPVHAGLIGADCLILLDEAHLAEPFRQTLDWTATYRNRNCRESDYAAPFGMSLLTATPGVAARDHFALDSNEHEKDTDHPILKRRLEVSKPVRLIQADDQTERQEKFVYEVGEALEAGARAISVVLNRVARARMVFKMLRGRLEPGQADVLLLIGPARPVQRDRIASSLEPIRTGAERALNRPIVIVATQSIEAGVDIDLDALFTEIAPLDALRQRFGRLNRNGRDMVPRAAIVAIKEELGSRSDDAVYGEALRNAWEALETAAERTKTTRKGAAESIVDFGLRQFSVPMTAGTLAPKADAPVLMSAHLALLSQTAPIPSADPDVALYLHGPLREPDGVTVIWRGDLDHDSKDLDVTRLLTLVPPRAGEAIELPLWAVKRWLTDDMAALDSLADISTAQPETPAGASTARPIFRWGGLDDRSKWISPMELRSGDTIVVPAFYGGIDEFGWFPESADVVTDVAQDAAEPYSGRRFSLRIAPGLLGSGVTPESLSRTLATVRYDRFEVVRDALLRLELPEELRNGLQLLACARRRSGHTAIEMHFDVYGMDADSQPRGVVFVAPLGLNEGANQEEGRTNSTEDDASGSLYGFAQTLADHSAEVEAKAEAFARAAGLPSARIADVKLAGFLHDEGKRDRRFQRWLHDGDPLGADPGDEGTVLAKSGRMLPPDARDKAGLPPRWRHEALSVRLARVHERLKQAADPDLVLWLVGTHHGHGRPLFPHCDPTEPSHDLGPQSLAFDWNGMDWPTLFAKLKVRYGVWELARMEAILRLADHRASEDAAMRTAR